MASMKAIPQWSCPQLAAKVIGAETRPECPHCNQPMVPIWEVILKRNKTGIGAVVAETRQDALRKMEECKSFKLFTGKLDVRPWLCAQK